MNDEALQRRCAAVLHRYFHPVILSEQDRDRLRKVMDGERTPSTTDLALIAIVANRSVDWLATGDQISTERMGLFLAREPWEEQP